MPCLPHLPAVALAASLCAQGAVTVTLPADRDNTLYESATGALSNGSGDSLFAGVAEQGRRRALLRFDVIGSVPAGARIMSASLRLHVQAASATGTMQVSAHRLLDDWGEGTSVSNGPQGTGAPAALFDATWRHRFHPTTYWVNHGGDYLATASASALTTQGGFQFWYPTLDLIADVQGFLDQPAQNYGWLLRLHHEGASGERCFASRECATPLLQPQLTIVYLPSGSVMALGLGCMGSGAQRLLLQAQGAVGPAFGVTLSGGRPGSIAVVLASFRLAMPPAVFYPGCSLLLDGSRGLSTHALLVLDATGAASMPYPVPNWVVGMEVGLQAWARDALLLPGYVLSNALLLRTQ